MSSHPCAAQVAQFLASSGRVIQTASSTPGHTQGSDLSRHRVLAARSLSTPTAQPAQKPTQLSATPTQSPTVQPTSIAQTQPTPIPQLASVSRSQPTATSYQWAWNQTSVQAQWMWSNAHLPDGICNVSVHIPSWYAGAPDAHYVLTATPNAGDSTTYAFDTQNQNQAVTTWIDLHINGQVPLLALPSSSDGIYTLTLTMQNGGTPNWYLGADAIRFNCSSSMPQ